jgi:hypothetical protein
VKPQIERDADRILREAANKEHKSMRDLGIIDDRRERTIRERETDFSDFFARRRRGQDAGA